MPARSQVRETFRRPECKIQSAPFAGYWMGRRKSLMEKGFHHDLRGLRCQFPHARRGARFSAVDCGSGEGGILSCRRHMGQRCGTQQRPPWQWQPATDSHPARTLPGACRLLGSIELMNPQNSMKKCPSGVFNIDAPSSDARISVREAQYFSSPVSPISSASSPALPTSDRYQESASPPKPIKRTLATARSQKAPSTSATPTAAA
jgi:hypothetical protein